MAIRIEIIGDDVTAILADMQKFADALTADRTYQFEVTQQDTAAQTELDLGETQDTAPPAEAKEPAKKTAKKSDKKTEKNTEKEKSTAVDDENPTLESVTKLAQGLYDIEAARDDVRGALKELGLKNFADIPDEKISPLNEALHAISEKHEEAA